MNKLKLLDLFSGIGGFSLGFEKTGAFETIAFCEKDEFCKKVLRKHWNHIRIYDEIRNLNGKEIKADVVTGGFPCQPFSVAGKRKGTDDDRYLWDETLRVIAETKPRWFVGENVEGIVNISEGKVLQQIQKDLESEGFQVQCLIIPASGVGAWHQRKRVWIIANSDSNRDWSSKSRSNEKKNSFSQEYRQKFSSSRKSVGTITNDVSNSKSGIGNVIYSDKEFSKAQTQEVSGNGNSLSKQKQSETWWQTQSELCGVPNGVSYELDKDRANRIKSLGNSIVPQIAFEIGKAIMEAELGS